MTTLDLFREIYGGRETTSGKTVNLLNALGVSTVYGCARVIGNGMAQVPLKLMKVSPDGKSRLPVFDHPLYDVLARQPNPWQTSFEFRQMMSWHVELAGNFYAYKNAPAGTVRELIPFQPGLVTVFRRDDMSLVYRVRAEVTGAEMEFPAEAIWHVRGPSWNSWTGIDFLKIAREAIGLSLAMEETQGTTFASGIQTTGVYSVEGKLSGPQHAELRAWIEKEYIGKGSSKFMLLDRSAKWTPTQMSAVDAQLNEARKTQVEEICRFFGVMPIMVGYTDKAPTYASAEQFFLAHAVHTLAPRWRMYEDSINANLLTEAERKGGYYSNFVEGGMIRGSAKDTKDVILGYVNGGVITPNEGRGWLDLNPDADPDNDKLRLPVNVAQASDPASTGTPGAPAA